MARTPETTILKGISAIEAAGGVDGFVREVLAEAKRTSMQRLQLEGPFNDPDKCSALFFECVTDIVLRRLEPDIERGYGERVLAAIQTCEHTDQVEAASERAFKDSERWAREVLDTAQSVVLGIDLLNMPEGESHA